MAVDGLGNTPVDDAVRTNPNGQVVGTLLRMRSRVKLQETAGKAPSDKWQADPPK